MQFRKTFLLAASLLSSARAVDLGNWYLYCGSSCSDGTLIASGDAQYDAYTDCEALSTIYEYCYFDCDGVCSEEAGDRWYLADLYGGSSCSSSATGVSSEIQPGECAEGPFGSYFVKLNI